MEIKRCPHCGVEWDEGAGAYVGDHHLACPWRDKQTPPDFYAPIDWGRELGIRKETNEYTS